jgi:hypothetical protein
MTARSFTSTFSKPASRKKFLLDNPRLTCNQELIMREAAELLLLDHCNVIKCFGICLERACLIMELAAKLITVELKAPPSIHCDNSSKQLVKCHWI